MRDDEKRFVLCEACGSEGRIYTARGNDPDWTDNGPCEACEGTGMALIDTVPVGRDDDCFGAA